MDNPIFNFKLCPPTTQADVVLDTDAYNEIDDQFAIAYLLRSAEKLRTVAIYAAPFFNRRSEGPTDGMWKSYDEIFKILTLCDKEQLKEHVFPGSEGYLTGEDIPIISPAAKDLANRAMSYTSEHPLYVVAIGAITNVASALLLNPEIKNRIVVIWLGGHAHHWCDTKEFNMRQDYAAARVVMGSGVPFVQLPCAGVVSEFRFSAPELNYWLTGKNPLADYLAKNTIQAAESYAAGKPWTRVIWDVTAVAWLLNDGEKLLRNRITNTRLPDYTGQYESPIPLPMCYVYGINRDALMEDLIRKLL